MPLHSDKNDAARRPVMELVADAMGAVSDASDERARAEGLLTTLAGGLGLPAVLYGADGALRAVHGVGAFRETLRSRSSEAAPVSLEEADLPEPARQELLERGYERVSTHALIAAHRAVGTLQIFWPRAPVPNAAYLHDLETAAKLLARAWVQARELEARGARLSAVDELTGLYSNSCFHRIIEAEVERGRRFREQLGLMLVDVDDLRLINREFGEAVGDRVLVRLSRVLRGSLRKMDTAFRYGGEEFAVVLPHCTEQGLCEAAERIRVRVSEEGGLDEFAGSVGVTVSVGAAHYWAGASIESLIHAADQALSQAKSRGKNRIECRSGGAVLVASAM